MNSHTIYSTRGCGAPPKPPTRIDLEAEIEQCRQELEGDSDGAAAVGYVALIVFVIFGCSLAYWGVTLFN